MPRLLYAGWFADRGDTDRAEFIRAQCGAEVTSSGELQDALLLRARQLLITHRAKWQQPITKLGCHSVVFRGGFPERVTMGGADFLNRGGEVFAVAPVTGLSFSTPINREDVQVLAASEHLRHLTSLTLAYNRIGSDGARFLAASANLHNLTSLDLGCNDIGNAGARALAASKHLCKLAELNLRHNRIGTEGMRALANSSVFRAEMRIAVNGFSGTFAGFQEWARSR